MKIDRHRKAARLSPSSELAELRGRLAETEETLRAIRGGEVDTVLVAGAGKQGPQVFTLHGAGHAYRELIESMNEGALMLASDMTILYANRCFAHMVKCPLEQVIGSSFRRFLSVEDRTRLRPIVKRIDRSGSKIQMVLNAGDGSPIPLQISLRPLTSEGSDALNIGMVLTDMTEARRTEGSLRALTQRVVHVQEAERGRVALELHDHITQLLCAILFRCEALVMELSTSGGPSMKEAMKLREMLGQTAGEVERISRNLRPGVLDHLGLIAVLRGTGAEFAERTGVSVKLACDELTSSLSPDAELALYRIFQEVLKNVEKHAHAKDVTVQLTNQGSSVCLIVKDDGVGFDSDRTPVKRRKMGNLGLLGMRERAIYVGGTFKINSAQGKGTEIEVKIPFHGSVQ